MKTVYYCMIVWMTLLPLGLFAQSESVVKGSVCDTNGPLPGANVRLVSLKNSSHIYGESTDAQGAFDIPLPRGKYSMEISFVGYATYSTHVEVKGNVALPPITLSEHSQLMDEVVVTARTVTYHSNGYVAEISKNAFFRNKDLSSILRLTPGTQVTPTGIEAYGGGISKVYLNGRELNLHGDALIRYLETIQGSRVKEMEVVIASGVEDDAASAGQAMLKITTINPETGGLLNLGGTAGYRMNSGSWGGNMNLQWRMNNHWGAYIRFTGMDTHETKGTVSEIHFFDTDERRKNESVNDGSRRNYNGTLGLTYDLDANNLFSLEGNYQATPSLHDHTNGTEHWRDGQYERTSDGVSTGNRDFNSFTLSFLYLHKFGKNGELTFKAESFRNKVDENEDQRYRYVSGEQREDNRLNTSDNRLHMLKADYTRRFPAVKGKLSAGVKAHWLTNDNRTDYQSATDGVANPYGNYKDMYKYAEDLYALYAKYNFTWKRFNLTAGMRVEHSVLSPQSLTNPERNEENSYTDFFPEVGFSYTINKAKGHNTSLSYNKSIHRPSIGFLNPLVQRTNEYNYTMGNPSLKPYATHSLSWTTHLFHKYIFRLYYDHSDDGFISLSESKDGDIYTTRHNGSRLSTFKAYASVPVQLGKNVKLTFNGSYSYNRTRYLEDEREFGSWNVGFSGMFDLPFGIDMMTNFSYFPPVKSLYGKTTSRPFAYMHVSKTFLKNKLNVAVLAGDLFDTLASTKSEYRYDTHWQMTKGSKRNYGAVLNVSYNLRWGQKSNVHQAGSSSDSGRFGTE